MTVRTAHIRRVVITRSREGNLELAKRLRAHGFEPVLVDTLDFLPPEDWSSVDESLRELGSYDWLVLTSATGVEFFAERMKRLSLSVPWKGRPRVAAVGSGTASALSTREIRVDFTPSHYLTRKLAEELPNTFGRRILLLRADIANPEMSRLLKKRGFSVNEFHVYRTKYSSNEEGKAVADADLILFASPSAVEGFCRKFAKKTLENLTDKQVVCIGPVTATAASKRGFERIIVPEVHTFDSLLKEIERLNNSDA